MTVGIEADEGLQQRRGQLVDQRNQPDLRERQAERVLQHGVDGQQDRLDHVVHQMRHADRAQHLEGGGRIRGSRRGGGGCGGGNMATGDAGGGILGGVHGSHT
ncbi:hypothetical protein D3C85_683550 [compost metagenome]